MKRIVIGDIHGHFYSLKEIYEKEQPDEVIVLGDYFDSFSGTPKTMVECFTNILSLRTEHLENKSGDFILLLGNHDFHYIMPGEIYSGYNYRYAYFAKTEIQKCIDNKIIKVVHIDNINKTIYSHAGITNLWMRNSNLNDIEDLNIINQINFKHLCHHGHDGYGNTPDNGPLWVRPSSLCSDIYKDKEGFIWTQIVGHTNTREPILIKKYENTISTVRYSEDDNNETIGYVIDCMPNYYIIEDIDENTKKINKREIVKNI